MHEPLSRRAEPHVCPAAEPEGIVASGNGDLREFAIGSASPRIEDERFLLGRGEYVSDLALPGMVHMAILRSPHAAATILDVDGRAAADMPGVLAVLTGEECAEDGLGLLRPMLVHNKRNGMPMPCPPYPLLARDAVHFVGDAVAAVVAGSAAEAEQALEAIAVTYQDGPSITELKEAVRPGAAPVWPHLAPDNICFVFEQGDRALVEKAFAQAAHVTGLDFRISRVSANPLEGRGAVGEFDSDTQRYTLYAGVQSPNSVRDIMADQILSVPKDRLRVVSPDIGGAFGMKGSVYPEYGLVLWAARRLGRPVRWVATRSESFMSDYHGRDNLSRVELALDANGAFLGLKVRTFANMGAYLGNRTPHSPTANLGGLAGVYRTPAIHAEVTGVFTNTQPTAPYRGAGRPEAIYAIERVIDIAADEIGIDRVELRRRNLIPAEAMPFKTGLVYTYDCGDFAANLEAALEAADWDGFSSRRAASRAKGRLRGIGLANVIEIAGGPAAQPLPEFAAIRFASDGGAEIRVGTHNHGQGHETTFLQMAASLLGLDPRRVRLVFGDTEAVERGVGTFGSRSVGVIGTSLKRVAERIIAQAKPIAAALLQAEEADVVFAAGFFTVAGNGRSVRIEEVARASALEPLGTGGLSAEAFESSPATFPNGCHVCEVEIDPDTGEVEVLGYVVAEDVGTVVNPLLLKGQIHGGVAQGLGQALSEAVVYDAANGQLLTASFMDYGMPRATDLPSIETLSNAVPTALNPFGTKGAGEAGVVGSLSAISNAVGDALRPLGIRHMDMPATPFRVWSAIRAARTERAASAPFATSPESGGR